MKFVDTFLFSEPYEADVLLVKLHLESPLVDEFVLVESDVTFRGDYKGLHAKKLLAEDERFGPFRGRVTVIEHRGRLYDGGATYKVFYENEERSRQLAGDYVLEKYSDEDFVFVSDADEALDATDPGRLDLFLQHTGSRPWGTFYFPHQRFWWDWDNLCFWKGIFTPVTQVKTIRKGHSSFRCRSRNVCFRVNVPTDPIIFFEFTFCFPREGCWRKLSSFIHDGYTEEELDLALLTNHWVKSAKRGERVGERGHEDWFELVELTEANSPRYVRENLEKLKTNIVDPNYREHRRRIYGV